MKTKLAVLTKVTVAGLIGLSVAIWMQWLSGDQAYTKFPPGPVFFIVIAGIIVLGARWWWTPLVGALISLLTTAGFFARLPMAMLRLTHPAHAGRFAAGIWIGTVLQIAALAVTDIAGVAATIQNYRRRENTNDSAKMACRIFGGIFVLMGTLIIVGRLPVDKYHNLMHLIWGVLAVGVSFMGETIAKHFCIGSGVFYLALAILGMLLGDPSMNRAWHLGPMLLNTGDHVFHLVLGTVFLGLGLLSDRTLRSHRIQQAGS